MTFFPDFFTNFLANILADLIIAIGLLIIITRPFERKQAQLAKNQALGLLKAEILANQERCLYHLQLLKNRDNKTIRRFPMRYTRGAWNALKESGFLPQVGDPILLYHFLRVNEAIVIADASLHRVTNAVRDENAKNLKYEIAIIDNERLLKALQPLIDMFEKMDLPEFPSNDLLELDVIQEPSFEQETTITN